MLFTRLKEKLCYLWRKLIFQKMIVSYRLRMENLIDVMENIESKISDKLKIDLSNEKDILTDLLVRINNRVHQVSPVPIYIFLLSAMTWFLWSTLYHVFIDWSRQASLVFSRVDFGGISLLIWGSMIAPIYYTMICDQTSTWRNFYIGFSIFSCSSAFISMFSPFISHPKNK